VEEVVAVGEVTRQLEVHGFHPQRQRQVQNLNTRRKLFVM